MRIVGGQEVCHMEVIVMRRHRNGSCCMASIVCRRGHAVLKMKTARHEATTWRCFVYSQALRTRDWCSCEGE